MKKMKLAWVTVLALLLAFAMVLCSCANTPDTTPSETEDPGTTGGNQVPDINDPVAQDDADLSLTFSEDGIATALVKESRKITVHTQSNYLLIEAAGSFTVTVNGETLSSENGALTVANTANAGNYATMDLQITVDAEMTLTFTLVFDAGTAGNPYVVSATEATVLTCDGDIYFTASAGWYTVTGDAAFELINYTLGEDGLVYLAEDTYTVGVKSGTASVTITPVKEAPVGYSRENPLPVSELGKTSLTMYRGMKLYFRFDAAQSGMYVFSLGSAGKSPNARFTVGDSDVYYGKYYSENGVWYIYDAGTTYGQWVEADGSVLIVVDYSAIGSTEDGTGMVGNDTIEISVAQPQQITVVKKDVTLTAGVNDTLYLAFTAPADGIYGIQLGGVGTADSKSSLTLDWDAENPTYYKLYETAVVKLNANETAYFAIANGSGNDGTVSVFISEEKTLPLPEEGWVSGYYKGSSYMITLDHDKAQVVFSNASGSSEYGTYPLTYDGEKVTFVQGEGEYATTWTLTYDYETGNITLEKSNKSYVLNWYVPVEKKDIATLQGIYKSEDGDELMIAADGSGIYQNGRYDYDGSNNYYNTGNIDNILHWGAYITIELSEDGNSVTVGNKDNSGNWTYTAYTRTADTYSIPANELSGIEDGEYAGNDYSLSIASGSQKFNNREFYILAVNDGAYTISGLSTSYDWTVFVLKITDSGIVLCDAEGTEVDVLTPYVYTPGQLPANEAETALDETVELESVYSLFRYYYVQKDGWYCFASATELRLSVPFASGDTYPTPYSGVVAENGTWYELKAGDLVAVNGSGITVCYSATAPAVEEDSNYAWDGSAIEDLSKVLTTTEDVSIKLTIPADGDYYIKITTTVAEKNQLRLTYNGVTYGRYWDSTLSDIVKWVDCDEQGGSTLGIRIKLTGCKAGDKIVFQLATTYKISFASNWSMSLVSAADEENNENTQTKIEDLYGTWEGSTSYGTSYKVVLSESGISYYKDSEAFASDVTYTFSDSTITFAAHNSWDTTGEYGTWEVSLVLGSDGKITVYEWGDRQATLTKTSSSSSDNGGSSSGMEKWFGNWATTSCSPWMTIYAMDNVYLEIDGTTYTGLTLAESLTPGTYRLDLGADIAYIRFLTSDEGVDYVELKLGDASYELYLYG